MPTVLDLHVLIERELKSEECSLGVDVLRTSIKSKDGDVRYMSKAEIVSSMSLEDWRRFHRWEGLNRRWWPRASIRDKAGRRIRSMVWKIVEPFK